MDPKIAIVLATYNGSRHLEEQVRSLQAQDLQDWQLFVRDDGSTDATPSTLAALARADSRIHVLPSDGRLGASANFGRLLEHALASGADYVFLCDQDDVWLPSKMSVLLASMRRLEERLGAATPLLVHSDLEVVDQSLRTIHESYLRYQGIAHAETDPLKVLLVQNFVTGCAAVANRALLRVALPVPPDAVMHDWWLALCAAACGRIAFSPDPLVRYRQHGSNEIGAGGARGALNPFDPRARKRFRQSWRAARSLVLQGRELLGRIRNAHAPQANVALVERFSGLDGEPPWRRPLTLLRLGVHCHRRAGTVFLYFQLSLAS